MFTHYAVEQRIRSVVAPVCLTSPRPVHRPSPLKSSPQRTGNDFHGSLLDGRGCILLGDLAFQASPGLDFSSAASSPLPPLPRIFIYSTVNRTHERESLFIEVLKISSAVNGIEIVWNWRNFRIYRRSVKTEFNINFGFFLFSSPRLSLFKENLETDGINNFQLNATRRLISFKHFTRSSNE